jgi:serine protease AprX
MSDEDFREFVDYSQVIMQLNRRHFIKYIATCHCSPKNYVMFPWADNGSLKDLLENTDRSYADWAPSAGLYKWALHQMLGLVGALGALHSLGRVHGTLKPASILHFAEFEDPEVSEKGTLVIAPAVIPVNSEAIAFRYSPPEIRGPASRKFDTWSIGCVFLEFAIWLLYGTDRLNEFITWTSRHVDSFYSHENGKVVVRSEVRAILSEIRNGSDDTALKDLVTLIDKSLLQSEDVRVDSDELYARLSQIVQKAESNSSYLFNEARLEKNPPQPRPITYSSKAAPLFPITFNGNTLSQEAKATSRDDAAYASQSRYVLVQTAKPLTALQKRELATLGVEVHEYVSKNTYLYGYQGNDLGQLRRLEYVTYADIYQQLFKVQPSLKSAAPTRTLSMSKTSHVVDVAFHEDVDPIPEDIKNSVAKQARVDASYMEIGSRVLRLTIQDRYLADVAKIDAVKAIQQVHPVMPHRNIARQILNANVIGNTVTQGEEVATVCVADSAIDQNHPEFAGRLAHVYSLAQRVKNGDPNGHGTHVAGSVLATAPTARLVFQSLLNSKGDLGALPADLSKLFRVPYQSNKVRVHTNSWGCTSEFLGEQLPYGKADAGAIDKFVFENRDMVILFAAGNDGTDRDGNGIIYPGQIGSEAAAKNCITVGATENERNDITDIYGELTIQQVGPSWWPPSRAAGRSKAFPVEPILNHQTSRHRDHVAPFSSRGPTRERRFKPDVVAPGTCILSTWPREVPPPGGIIINDHLAYDSGTSMATPLVAGCAAVLQQTLLNNRKPDTSADWSPSAALIKALLINGAVWLNDQYSPGWDGPRPNYSSGFGRVNLANSIAHCTTNFGNYVKADYCEGGPIEEAPGETPEDTPEETPEDTSEDTSEDTPEETPEETPPENQRHRVKIEIPEVALSATFKITLAWADAPGEHLQNDLDLIVRASDTTERHGNMGFSKEFDDYNNVEQIHWTSMPPGPAEIEVVARRITKSPQYFAYAWSIKDGIGPE